MEIPCRLKFAGSSRNIRKMKQDLQDLDSPCVIIFALGFRSPVLTLHVYEGPKVETKW